MPIIQTRHCLIKTVQWAASTRAHTHIWSARIVPAETEETAIVYIQALSHKPQTPRNAEKQQDPLCFHTAFSLKAD